MAKQTLPQNLEVCLIAAKFPILGRAVDHGFLWPVARGLSLQGHKIRVIAWKNPLGKKEIEQDGILAKFLGEGNYRSFSEFPSLALEEFKKLHAQKSFHLVHSVDSSGYLIGQQKKFLKVAMAYDIEATQMSQIFSILAMSQESLGSLLRTSFAVGYKYLTTYYSKDAKLLSTADAMFVTSPQQRLALERYYLYPDYKTYTVPYGLDIGDLSPREKSEELRKKLNLPVNADTVVTITDMTEIGEMRSLLRAFEKVAVKKTTARLIVVGNGPLKKEIEFEMLNLALGRRVIFTGAVSNTDLPEYIAQANVVVNLSSRTSGLEPSMLEAMAQEKVIIGSEVSPIATIVEDGTDGFLIRPADVDSLSTLLVQIFAGQLPAAQIGQNARQKVMNLFDTRKIVSQTMTAYLKTLINTGWYRKQGMEKVLSI